MFQRVGLTTNPFKPCSMFIGCPKLTHWGRATHICVGNLAIIGSDNGLSPGRRQVIIWTNDEILLIRPLGTNFSEILIEINAFSFKKLLLKTSSAKWRLFCLGLNVLRGNPINGVCHPVAIAEATNAPLSNVVKPLQLVWRSGTHMGLDLTISQENVFISLTVSSCD